MVPVESEGRKRGVEGGEALDTFFMFIINNGCNYYLESGCLQYCTLHVL